MIQTGWRIAALAWRQHYRIPESIYWLLVGLGTLGFALFGLASMGYAVAVLFVLVLGAQGIARWRYARRHGHASVVIPRFACTDGTKAIEIQKTVLATLQDHLSFEEMQSVHHVPTTVGQADRKEAARLCKRLRASLVLQGDVRSGSGGTWSVYASACSPLSPEVVHVDSHTRDITPAKAGWAWIFHSLTGVDEIPQREYPLEFADELQAVVRATAGQVALQLGDFNKAEKLLHAALSVAPKSDSPQLDELRVARAKALALAGDEAEALRVLRRRARQPGASPEVRRTLALFLTLPFRETSEAARQEAVKQLRLAADVRPDPQRELTLFNLAMNLHPQKKSEDVERREILEELSERSQNYTKVWHVKRLRGSVAFNDYWQTKQKGHPDIELARASAHWYPATIRARPRFLDLRFIRARCVSSRRL